MRFVEVEGVVIRADGLLCVEMGNPGIDDMLSLYLTYSDGVQITPYFNSTVQAAAAYERLRALLVGEGGDVRKPHPASCPLCRPHVAWD
jgi:hypothetical protein